MLKIDETNYREPYEAMLDILYIYYSLIKDHNGSFFSSIELGKFDFLYLINCQLSESASPVFYESYALDQILIHQGSAVALLIKLANELKENNNNLNEQSELVKNVEILLNNGDLDHLKLATDTISSLLLKDYQGFLEGCYRVYREYVFAYFYFVGCPEGDENYS